MYLIAKIDENYFKTINEIIDKDKFKAESQNEFV